MNLLARIVVALLCLTAAHAQDVNSTKPYTAQGTWTVTFIGSGTPGTGQTYNNQQGSYEQIGRLVVVRLDLNMSSLGTAAGNAIIAGLPIAANSGAGTEKGTCSIGYVNMNGTSPPAGVIALIDPSTSTTQIQLYGFGSSSAALTVVQAGAAFRVIMTCVYRTT